MAKSTRRGVLKGAGALIAAAAAGTSFPTPSLSQGPKKITFLTSWSPEGSNFYAWLAKERGYWKARGLDVDVLRGTGSGMAAQSIGSSPDKFEFGMSSSSTLTLQAAKGLPIVCLGMINYDANMGVAVKASGPIKTAAQLAGTKWAATPTSGEYPFLALFAKKAGFDFASVKMQQVAGNVRESLLLRGEVDAVSASASTAISALEPQGFDTRFFLFSTVGIKFYGQAVVTQQQRLKDDPGLCEAVFDGAMEAIKYTITNPQDTLAEMTKMHSDLTLSESGRKAMAIGFGISQAFTIVPELMENGIGYADLKSLQTAIDTIMEYSAAPGDKAPTAEQLLTNRFAGKMKVTAAQAEACRAWASQYTKGLV